MRLEIIPVKGYCFVWNFFSQCSVFVRSRNICCAGLESLRIVAVVLYCLRLLKQMGERDACKINAKGLRHQTDVVITIRLMNVHSSCYTVISHSLQDKNQVQSINMVVNHYLFSQDVFLKSATWVITKLTLTSYSLPEEAITSLALIASYFQQEHADFLRFGVVLIIHFH